MAKPRTLFLVTSLLSLVVYVRTLAPTITWRNAGADSGDLAAAVAVLALSPILPVVTAVMVGLAQAWTYMLVWG